jgi:hypothetical protein
MATVPFFYDDQIRRFLIQFTRMFSNYQVEYGKDASGAATLVRVPVRYGDASRQASAIIADNSRNKMPNAPMMSFHITALDYARDRVQDPYFVDKKSFKQRTWDEDTQTYEQTQGNAFTVERLMPVPYNMTIQLDVWASNTQMKLQILEQILPLFNPSMEIQSTDNYIDWTSLTVVELTGTNWSSRTIPVGTDDNIDVATLTFSIPIWLTMPAKVKKLGVIHKIIASIYDTDGNAADAIVDDDILMGTRQKITPFGYQILLIGNQIQLLEHEQVDPADGTLTKSDLIDTSNPLVWSGYIDTFGELRDGISQIRLSSPHIDTEIVGTVAKHPTDDRILLFSVDADTIPGNTLTAVNAVIDPLSSGPGEGLVAAATGQRYLLTDAIGDAGNTTPASAWGSVVASENDIIEYNGSEWYVAWKASEHTADNSTDITDYVTNLTTSVQYKWTGTMWVKSYQGIYKGGEWSLVL